MAKTLIIIRHGKAEEGFNQRDFDRHLAPKGIQQAESNGRKLQQRGTKVDLLLHSSAQRTTETANILLDHIQDENIRVFSNPNLYLCPSSKISEELVKHAKNTDKVVVLVGHNNGLSDFFNQLVSSNLYHNLSTCEMATLSLDIQDWDDLYHHYNYQILSIEKPH